MPNYPAIALPTEEGLLFVRPSEILYGIAQRSETLFYLTDDRIYRISKKLKDVLQLLEDEHFVRIHHSHFINLEHAVRLEEEEIWLSDGTSLRVSRSRRGDLLGWFRRI